jgi:hypothetical protein
MQVFSENVRATLARNGKVALARNISLTSIISFIVTLGVSQLSAPYSGIYQGGDSSFPWTLADAWNQLASVLNPWNTFSLATGYYSADNSSWFLPLARAVGIEVLGNPALVQRLEILFLIQFAGTSMYFLVQSFGLNKFSAIFSGLVYGFSPVAFNFTVMGWNSLLLTYSSIPLLILLLKVTNGSNKKISSVVFFAVGILSGAILTGSAAFPSFLIVILIAWHSPDRWTAEQFKTSIKRITALVFGFFIINAFWILPRLIFSPVSDNSTLQEISSSKISVGARTFFWFSSLFTGDYSQYNNSFFAVFPSSLKSFLVMLSVLAGLSFFVTRKESLKHLSRALVLIWLFIATLTLSPLLINFGIVGLLFGREPPRLYGLVFLCVVLLASIFVSKYSEYPQPLVGLKVGLLILLVVVQISPFLLAKLEASVMPPQPALTLRPSPIDLEFSEVYNLVEQNKKGFSSVLIIPGSPTYRLLDARARFEPNFNMVAGVGMHLPLPATWWATDKIPSSFRKVIELRGPKITSGRVEDLLEILRDQNSNLVLVDRLGLTPGDEKTLTILSESGRFIELTKRFPKSLGERRWRLFKSLEPKSNYVSAHEAINFLNSSSNPIGATIRLCSTQIQPQTDNFTLKMPFTYSKYWSVKVRSHSKNQGCFAQNSVTTSLEPRISSNNGFMQVEFSPVAPGNNYELKLEFLPAKVQQDLILLTVAFIISLCLFLSGLYLKRLSQAIGESP